MTKPLLFLDVDGVLNPEAPSSGRRPEGYLTHRMRPSGAWQLPWSKPLRVWLNPEHGDQLLALGYELVWATTWQHEANEWIAPHVGLPELPVVEFPASPSRFGGLHWKTKYLVEYAESRPFAWVDDELTNYDRKYMDIYAPDSLLHHVNHRLGLLKADFQVLAEWACRAIPCEPK